MVCGYLKDLDTNTFTIELILTSKLEDKSAPTKIVVVAPTPKTASKITLKVNWLCSSFIETHIQLSIYQVSAGRAKFKSALSAIVWKYDALLFLSMSIN